jgi:hypothetical protein
MRTCDGRLIQPDWFYRKPTPGRPTPAFQRDRFEIGTAEREDGDKAPSFSEGWTASANPRAGAFLPSTRTKTPQVDGTVSAVSAVSVDAITQETTGASFYEVMIEIPEDALTSTGLQLLPGMPVEASLTTESRNALNCLVKPLMITLAGTFRKQEGQVNRFTTQKNYCVVIDNYSLPHNNFFVW